MNTISVKTKIRTLGALLIISIFVVICTTIYLNQENVKDATIVNIAGKQRMLTQQITKNIFYAYEVKSNDFTRLNNAIKEFNYGLNTLENGNKLLSIRPSPTQKISSQISKVKILWNKFEKNTNEFKVALLQNDTQKLNSILKFIYVANTKLLKEVDKVVTLYANYIEEKTDFIEKFQYSSFLLIFLLATYSIFQLRQIENNAREFIEKSKKISQASMEEMKPLNVKSEKEFVEVANNFNSFITRVNSAMNYSQNALEQSKLASNKLEDVTQEFGTIINELENKSQLLDELDKSEDIAIESTDNLLKTTRKLQDLKFRLDLILNNHESHPEEV